MASLVPRPSAKDAFQRPGSGQLSVIPQPSLSSFPSRTASVGSLQNGAAATMSRSRSHRTASNESRQSQYIRPPTPPVARSRSRPRTWSPLKPQYPRNSVEPHVEYILVASFDIDKGSTMEHQYPTPIYGDEHMLAGLMIPDQMHKRDEDWTVFFLHKDGDEQQEDRQARREEKRQQKMQHRQARAERQAMGETGIYDEMAASSGDDESDEEEGAPLIYVLNLVNQKMLDNPRDNRGAVVKAMAICTRHSFLHIYKPLLLLALQDYFKKPEVETLSNLFNAVNSMDLSLLPRFSTFERRLLLSTDKQNLFTEKFDRMIQQRTEEEQQLSSEGSMRTKGLTIPRDTREFESRVVYNQIPIPIKVPSALSPETVGDFSIIKLIDTFSAPHAQSPQPFALHPHLTPNGAYTHPILVLINAVLTQKRIIFLGDERPSVEVAEAVLATCALCSGTVLRGFTRHAFPYTDLTKVDDLLNVPGFIAGVTNSVFANHLEWWDLLCDISKGRMKISTRIEPAIPTEGLLSFQQQHPQFAPSNSGILPTMTGSSNDPKATDPTGEIAFIEDIQRSIAARQGEHAIRSKWHQYIVRFLRLASAFEEMIFGASALDVGAAEADSGALGVIGHGCVWPDENVKIRELAAFVWRIEGWRNTRSYYAFVQDIAKFWSRQPIRQLDIPHQLDRLRLLKLSREESGKVYLALRDAIQSYDEICQLLAAAPESQVSIFHIGLGLFHPDVEAREATAELLERIREHEVGRHYWPQLGRFARVALSRIQRDMIDARAEEENEINGTGFTMTRTGRGERSFS